MRLKNLTLKNIGPFKEAELEFISDDNGLDNPPVICITGENGTGKSIILDSIRSLFMGRFNSVERDITSSSQFLIKTDLQINGVDKTLSTHSKYSDRDALDSNDMQINTLFHYHLESIYQKNFIMDYWTSKLSSDKFDISNITSLDVKKYLDNSLDGIHKNIDVTRIITFFDYLKDSSNEYEEELGATLYSILKEIINISITDGELSHVSRIDLKPIIKIGNDAVSLDKLSSGNLYLIQRFVSLLNQVYAVCTLNNIPISKYKSIPGLLLIDEAENHLHPKWQKLFLENILSLFPKLQIILATHSPFLVSSIRNTRIYVCKSLIDKSIVVEETDYYVNKPIEEILLSPLFSTSNFGNTISKLLEDRKDAINSNNDEEAKRIEKMLLVINPEYFNYLNLDSILKSIKK